MLLIKRYANRKLYDTQARQYVTLEEIAAHVRAGQEIQVIDNDSNADLTAQILSQIILEQEKQRRGFLPHGVLTALVEGGGTNLKNLREKLARPLELLSQVDEQIEARISQLVEKGELAEESARQLRQKLIERSRELSSNPALAEDVPLQVILERQGLPTRDDLQRLNQQIEALADKLTELDL
ncbi:MAG: hypothetical protein JW862_11820 [Anaerolineales bacterium]|nr:hypothetical protein [Anaerolineales bacterium]